MRDDFSEEVKRIVAARVNHRCSNPSCRASTSGPQVNPSKAVNIGVAAHITAASIGGPRYDISLTSEQRRHSNNAIWLCQACAKLIDNDETRFQVSTLREWKTKAEADALALIGKTSPPSNSTLTVPDNYYDVLSKLNIARRRLEEGRSHSHNFYNGTEPTWLNIAADDDISRDVADSLLEFIVSHKNDDSTIPVALVLGRAGDGKSTLLMRVAATLADRRYLVFWHKPDSTSLSTDAIEKLCEDSLVVLFIDDVTRLDVEVLENSLRYWHSVSSRLIIIMSSREDLWGGLQPILETCTRLLQFSLHYLSDKEISLLLDRLSATAELGDLALLSRKEQEKRFKKDADRQLLVALLEAKYNMSFARIVQRNLRDIETKFSPYVSQACYLVAALHTFGVGVPTDWLTETLNLTSLEADVLAKTRGFLVAPQIKHYGLGTRHALVSTVVFDNDEGRYDRLHKFITTLNRNKTQLIPKLFRNIRLQFQSRNLNIEQVRSIFGLATTPTNIGRYTFILWTLLEKDLGNWEYARSLYRKATSEDPTFQDYWLSWASMEKDLGNYDKAQLLLNEAIKLNPNEATTWQNLALLAKEKKNFKEARYLFKQATVVDPKHAPTWQLWAIMEKELGKFAQARYLFEQAAKIDAVYYATTRGAIWQSWALMEKEAGNLKKARQLFIKAYKINPRNLPTLQAWAITEKELRNYEKARSLFDEALQIDPSHSYSLQAKAIMEKEAGHYEEARILFQRGIKSAKNNGPSFQAWAIMEKELGNYEQARHLFDQATIVDPNHTPVWQAWAIMEKELGNYEQARFLFEKATKSKYGREYAWQAWGVMEKELGNYEQARFLFEKASVSAPQKSSCWQPWALLELEIGNRKKAYELAQRAVKLAATNEFHPFIARGLIRRSLGDIEGSKSDFKQAQFILERNLSQHHKDRRILIPLANVLTYLENYQDAERVLRRLLKYSTSGQKQYALNALGELYEAQGALGQAVKTWEEALTYAPSYPPVLNNLMRVRDGNVSKHV